MRLLCAQRPYNHIQDFDNYFIMLYLFWEISTILLQRCKMRQINMELTTDMLSWMQLQNAADYKVTSAITSTSDPYLAMWSDGRYEDDYLYLFRKSVKRITLKWEFISQLKFKGRKINLLKKSGTKMNREVCHSLWKKNPSPCWVPNPVCKFCISAEPGCIKPV